MEEKFICENCGAIVERLFNVDVNGREQEWCEGCVDDYATSCDCCGCLVSQDTVQIVNDTSYCDDCFSDECGYCEGCGGTFHMDDLFYSEHDGCYYCDDCYNNQYFIHGYHRYDDDWQFLGGWDREANLHIGVELEVDEGGEDNENARDIVTTISPAEYMVASEDGSLSDGFEMISYPATLHYHTHGYKWAEGMKLAHSRGYSSHDCGTCGLHMHLDREYLENPFINTEYAFVVLVSNNAEFFKGFSRRRSFDYCSFEYFDHAFTNFQKNYLKYEEQMYRGVRNGNTRYNAVNFRNDETIELRFFRGTLNYNTFVASLQLAQMMCDIVKNAHSLQAVASVEKSTFKAIAKHRGYLEYLQYIKNRRVVL